jgi:hypothetical protein
MLKLLLEAVVKKILKQHAGKIPVGGTLPLKGVLPQVRALGMRFSFILHRDE